MAKVLYVRHGQTESNAKGVFAGGANETPLTEEGIEQAKQAGRELRNLTIDRIICSPMSRAFDTASIIAQQIGFDTDKIVKDSRIKEYDTGEYGGMPMKGTTSEKLVNAKGAEDPQEFANRVKGAMQDVSKYEGITLIVGHGGTAKMIDCLRTGGDPARFFDAPKKPNAHAFELDLSWLDSKE